MIRKFVLASIAFLFTVTTLIVTPANAADYDYSANNQTNPYTQQDQQSLQQKNNIQPQYLGVDQEYQQQESQQTQTSQQTPKQQAQFQSEQNKNNQVFQEDQQTKFQSEQNKNNQKS